MMATPAPKPALLRAEAHRFGTGPEASTRVVADIVERDQVRVAQGGDLAPA